MCTSSRGGRGHLKCDGTRAETRFRLSAKWTSPFKSAGVSVQSTTGSRDVRISGGNAGYTMFRGSVKCTGYPLHSPVSPSLMLCPRNLYTNFNCDNQKRMFTFSRKQNVSKSDYSALIPTHIHRDEHLCLSA